MANDTDPRSDVLARLEPALRERVLTVLRPLSPEARRMTGMQRLDTLLSVPEPQTFVPSLPTQELYFFLQEVGLEDCTELVRYASPEQLQGFVDLGAWQKDEFDIEAFRRWYDIAAHNGPDEVRRLMRSLDPELLSLMLLRSSTIYDAREVPEGLPDDVTLLPTPDGSFQLAIEAGAEERIPLLEALLDSVYAHDVEEGRKFVQACRWEFASELEEGLYRWRTARLEDLGFLPPDEAAEAESDLDIGQLERALRQGTSAGEPGFERAEAHPFTGWFVAHATDAPYLERLLAELPDGEPRDRLLHGFVALVNRRLSLRGHDRGEWEALEDESAHGFRMVSIGLERLVRGTGAGGAELLARLPLLACYRVGRTLLSGLRRRAMRLLERGGVATGQNPFDPPLDDWLTALRMTPPRRWSGRPARPAGEGAEAARPADVFVPFRTLAEVDEADRLLARGEAVLFFFEHRYGWGPERFAAPDLAGLDDAQRTLATFSTLLLTGMANRILDRSTDLRPLAAPDVRDLLQMLFVPAPGGRKVDPRLRREAQEQLVAVSGKMKDTEREALFSFVNEALTRLEETLGGLAPGAVPDVRWLGGVLLVTG